MTKLVVVAVCAPALTHINSFLQDFQRNFPHHSLEAQLFYVAEGSPALAEDFPRIAAAIAGADIAIVDIMGASDVLRDVVRRALADCSGQRIVIGNAGRELIRLGAFSMERMRMMGKTGDPGKNPESADESQKNPDRESSGRSLDVPGQSDGAGKKKSSAAKMHTMRRMALMMGSIVPFGMMKDMRTLFLLIDYWQQASRADMDSFMYLLLRRYAGMKDLPREKPCTMKYGIYLKHPETERCTESLGAFWKREHFDPDRPLVALLFYGHRYPNDFLPVVCALYRRIAEFANVLPIAFSQNEDRDLPKLEDYLTGNRRPVDAIVNLMPFRLGAGPMGGDADGAVSILKKVNAPYFKPFCLTKTGADEWELQQSVNAGEFLISMMLPELDGGLHTYPVGVMRRSGLSAAITPIPERIETFGRRLENWICLRNLPNDQKRLAIICYNYPPGEDNLFGGAFLDTFSSMEKLLKALAESGYQTEALTAEQLKEQFTDHIVNEPVWKDIPDAAQSYVLHGVHIPVYGLQLGHVFLGLQPCRTEDMRDVESSYHDRNRTPPAAYQAFYRWIREEFRADAMVHIGTHGTLEFLPGKDTGMMGSCWPDRLVGTIPHFYYYYIGNPSEAMTAKRRTHAGLISYAPPAFRPSGLYGEYQRLKETIAEYRESLKLAPEQSADLLETIRQQAMELGLARGDASVDTNNRHTESRPGRRERENGYRKAAGVDVDALDERLYEYETSLIPDGLHIADETELDAILAALQGGYLPVSPAGDVFRHPDLLPAGRNLVQFDPRLVPTKTAFERGRIAAEQAMDAYRQKTGRTLTSTAVILWGLETSKTHGETVGQIMHYLGVRLREDAGSFDNRFEIIPMEELGRPRVDVTIHICGFFRDMYPGLLEHLGTILRKLEALQESDEQSAFAKNTRSNYAALTEAGMPPEQAKELAICRIFGPKEGEYGTSLTRRVHNGSWKEEAELALDFTRSLSYAYTGTKRGAAVPGLLEQNYRQVEMMSQIRNNTEYELIDLDHYYEFYGGLAKAVEQVQGHPVEMLVTDTTGDRIRTGSLQASLEKGIRTRLLHPDWIEGMMRHDYHGVQQIARRFENIIGMAATTSQIESSIFSDLERCYVEDEALRRRMQQSNSWAYLSMLGRLVEADNRGYWNATQKERDLLRRVYLETEGAAEDE